ncbi:MAG TPA: rhomboid family intramembrane serine protease [Nocardioidaceae bacterium]|nr:rhomboid family intramembrane serine protease [Nocardioidaceae bacterium]
MSVPASETAGSRVATAGQVIGAFVFLLYAVELLDQILGERLDGGGIQPRESDGLDGILWAPLLHGGWWHLIGNTLPLLVLGFMILLSGVSRWVSVTAIVWLVGGLGTWLTGGEFTIHLGASGLVFGWLTYLLLRGLFSRRPGQIAVGVVVLLAYGGALWGVLPNQPGISWQGHLFGAIGGTLAAWWLGARDRQAVPQ